MKNMVNGRQSGENVKTDEIKAEIKVTDIQDRKEQPGWRKRAGAGTGSCLCF